MLCKARKISESLNVSISTKMLPNIFYLDTPPCTLSNWSHSSCCNIASSSNSSFSSKTQNSRRKQSTPQKAYNKTSSLEDYSVLLKFEMLNTSTNNMPTLKIIPLAHRRAVRKWKQRSKRFVCDDEWELYSTCD